MRAPLQIKAMYDIDKRSGANIECKTQLHLDSKSSSCAVVVMIVKSSNNLPRDRPGNKNNKKKTTEHKNDLKRHTREHSSFHRK